MKEFIPKKQSYRLNTIDISFLEKSIKNTWEGSCKRVKGKEYNPVGMVFIDANILPSQVLKHLDEATADKLGFNYTGPHEFDHLDEITLVENILENSKELFKYLPVLLLIGVECVLQKCTPSQVAELESVLKKKGSLREGQRIVTYDLTRQFIRDAFIHFSLPLPMAFRHESSNRTSLIYFNTSEEVIRILSACL